MFNLFLPLLILIGIVLSPMHGRTQDKILLLNGKSYTGKYLSSSPDLVNFNFKKKSGKIKSFSFESNRVYSYKVGNNEEVVLYKKDTSIYNYYTPDQMRMFIYGEEDAYHRFKVKQTWLVGFAVGLGTSLYDTYLSSSYVCPNSNVTIPKGFLNREPSIAQFIVPFVVPIVTGAIKPKMKAKHASDPTFLANEFYIEGFKKVRRFKRVKSSLFGSLCGVAVGMIAYSINSTSCN